jgi:hypothetical protein
MSVQVHIEQSAEVVTVEWYQCPDERSRLTRVVCLARQAHNYEKCVCCTHCGPAPARPEHIRWLED